MKLVLFYCSIHDIMEMDFYHGRILDMLFDC